MPGVDLCLLARAMDLFLLLRVVDLFLLLRAVYLFLLVRAVGSFVACASELEESWNEFIVHLSDRLTWLDIAVAGCLGNHEGIEHCIEGHA